MLKCLKPFAHALLKPLAVLLKDVNPNYITAFGLVFPILFFICLINKLYVWAAVIFIFNAVDMLDGMVARAQKKETPFGAFLDSTIDRFSDFTIIVAFAFAGLAQWVVVIPLLLLTYLISYVRSRTELAAKATLTADVGLIERTERLVLILFALIVYILLPSLVVSGFNIIEIIFLGISILSIITLIQRIQFAYRKL